MTDSQKMPTILVIDDEVAGDDWHINYALKNITDVADALGYDDQQKEQIKKSVRFFAQYDEHDGEQLRDKCAVHYISDRNGDTEIPVLIFTDNHFGKMHHGKDIIVQSLSAAEDRREMMPALVWISSDPSPHKDIVCAGKLDLHGVKRWQKSLLESALDCFIPKDGLERGEEVVVKKEVFNLAKSPYDGDSDTRGDQAIIHTLRDAFCTIAGPAKNREVWQRWISKRNANKVPGKG